MWTQTQTIATRPQASAAPVAGEVSSLLLTHDAEGMKDRVLKATFLCGVTGAAMTTLLKTAKRVPIFGEVFSLLADIKEYVEVFVETEEESKRMSVWCVSLMAVLGRLAQETQGDRDSEQMLKNAAGALRSVKVFDTSCFALTFHTHVAVCLVFINHPIPSGGAPRRSRVVA